MAIAERINYFRNKCSMTMKYLGQRLGYAEKSADVAFCGAQWPLVRCQWPPGVTSGRG